MSDQQTSLFRTILSDAGYRVTNARLKLFHLLVGTKPLSIQDILLKANGTIDRVGVYRNVELFETLGIIRRITIGWKYKIELSDAFTPHHHHLVCITCGNVADIKADEKIEQFIYEVAKSYRFRPISHQFEVEGYCQLCSKENAQYQAIR